MSKRENELEEKFLKDMVSVTQSHNISDFPFHKCGLKDRQGWIKSFFNEFQLSLTVKFNIKFVTLVINDYSIWFHIHC